MFDDEIIKKFWSKVDRSSSPDDCWLWTGALSPYGNFYYDKKRIYAHRFSFTITYGDIPNGVLICHKCDNPACCNPRHLFLGSSQDNNQDCLAKGRHKCARMPGSKNAAAKLSEQQVLEIRGLKMRHKDIALLYGVSKATIDDIRGRVTWKHI